MYLARQISGPSLGPVSNANHGRSIIGITGFFTSFACLVVLARFYVRAVMLKTFGIDDYIMLVAMVGKSSHHFDSWLTLTRYAQRQCSLVLSWRLSLVLGSILAIPKFLRIL